MSAVVRLNPIQCDLVKVVLAKVRCNGKHMLALQYCEENYGAGHASTQYLKATVGGLPQVGSNLIVDSLHSEFWNYVRPATVLGKVPFRRVPFNIRNVSQTAGATSAWVGDGKGIPVSKMAFTGAAFAPLQLGTLTVVDEEIVRFSKDGGLALIQADLKAAIAAGVDAALLDPAIAAVTDVSPGSLTNGLSPLVSTQNPNKDFAAAFAAYTGNPETMVAISDPRTWMEIASFRDANGQQFYPDLGPKGGTVFGGIPAISSRASPRPIAGSPTIGRGQIVLVDADAVCLGDDGISLDSSGEATVEMRSDPVGSSVLIGSPQTTNPQQMVSLFQSHSTAFRCVNYVNWQAVRTGSVVLITQCRYLQG